MKLNFKNALDGSVIYYTGSLDNKNIILIVGRNNFLKDDKLIESLIESLHNENRTIIWYEYADIFTARLFRNEHNGYVEKFKSKKFLHRFYERCKNIIFVRAFKEAALKILVLCRHPQRLRYRKSSAAVDAREIESKAGELRRFIQSLGEGRNICILSRSAGGRISSLAEDEPSVRKLVCLGYPFKHPDMPEEPERFSHLAHMKKPFLIIQGKRDEYGGEDILKRYTLSPRISVEFIDSDHDLKMSETAWNNVEKRIKSFLTQT